MEKSNTFEVIVRTSFVLLFLKLLFLQLLFVGLYSILLWQFDMFNAPLKSGGILLFFLLQSAQIFISLAVVMKWFFLYYKITEKDIVCQKGVILQNRRCYSLEKVESVELSKGLWGRIFNYGEIIVTIHHSDYRDTVRIKKIPAPERYVEIIERSLQDFGSKD